MGGWNFSTLIALSHDLAIIIAHQEVVTQDLLIYAGEDSPNNSPQANVNTDICKCLQLPEIHITK
jgi:hypothetical protein